MNDISRRNIIELLPYSVFPVIIHPKYVLAYKNTRLADIKDDIVINKVAVFGASYIITLFTFQTPIFNY
jgi:hypothetical protein